jgi:hypothetical protein
MRRSDGREGGGITFDAIIFMQIIPDVFAGMGARKMGDGDQPIHVHRHLLEQLRMISQH